MAQRGHSCQRTILPSYGGQPHHLFQPLLYQAATAGLPASDIAAPPRHIVRRQRNVQVLMAEANGIDLAGKAAQLSGPISSQTLRYHQLQAASGATHAYFGHDDWAAHAPGLKNSVLAGACAVHRWTVYWRCVELPPTSASVQAVAIPPVALVAGETNLGVVQPNEARYVANHRALPHRHAARQA